MRTDRTTQEEKTMSTMTRSEAMSRIEECETLEEVTALHVEWIGHDEHGETTRDGVADILADYVNEACLTDKVRSRGPRDSDDTSIPA